MSEQDTTTIKHGGLLESGENEIDAARTAYLQAYEAWVEMPTIINLQIRNAAYDHLQHVKSLYSAARKALIQKNIIERQ